MLEICRKKLFVSNNSTIKTPLFFPVTSFVHRVIKLVAISKSLFLSANRQFLNLSAFSLPVLFTQAQLTVIEIGLLRRLSIYQLRFQYINFLGFPVFGKLPSLVN